MRSIQKYILKDISKRSMKFKYINREYNLMNILPDDMSPNAYKLTKTDAELEEIKRNCRLEPWKECYYFTKGQKSGQLNDSAKLFYKLTVPNIGVFKVEVRHKGEFTSSPQFQVIKTCEMIVMELD
mgnify:CR=1 FL=1